MSSNAKELLDQDPDKATINSTERYPHLKSRQGDLGLTDEPSIYKTDSVCIHCIMESDEYLSIIFFSYSIYL